MGTRNRARGKIRYRYEDYANINLLYEDERNAFVESNWLTPRRVRTLTVTGTEGIMTSTTRRSSSPSRTTR